jgi:uracil-DNA glycosylase
MSQNLNIEEIKEKFYQKLLPSGWGRVLKSFIFSGDFDNIIFQLVKKSNTGEKFTPLFKDLFRAFEECPYSELCVVIVAQEPHHEINVADGLAFSSKKFPYTPLPLSLLLQEVNRTVYDNRRESVDGDLTRWSNQGILLLNIALTTTIGKANAAHYEIWKPFISYLFDWLNKYNNGLVYVFMGRKAQEWESFINDSNTKFSLPHPVTGAYTKDKTWDSEELFPKVAEVVENLYNKKLIW